MEVAYIMRVNMSAIVLNILINAFYIACLVRPFRGETPKQPLSLLLWTMLCCNLSFQVSVQVLFFFVNASIGLIVSIFGIFIFSLSTSMTTTVWLNFLYFIQIVPLKSPVFLWMKRNHKATIYCIWMVEKLIIGITVTSIVMFDVSVFSQISDLMSFNATFNSDTVFNKLPSHLIKLAKATMIMNEVYFVICLFIMSLSSLSTAIYLSRHLRQMASKVRSCSLFRSQVRVTVTGILQGALYVLLSAWILSRFMFYDIVVGPAAYMTLANITVINVYMMGTIVNLGVGQAVFRQRAVDLWHRAARCCTTMRAQQPQKG
ncbi:taste receptor type 2 member 1-like isoform X1 [Takifugu flavidus]|nr:taste receptor type 2 member 1-like isoform X1 [Takifugu flavidus]XP_056896178.1 taste receptor type 2 member 1-like isoform X1 [Takifugu flavidus]XP_056896186.1 taste receptor type 2 member 1-like isoform X1 [Takifugu flavidus]XP_056896194.1 taste receptor type 2 member 1-like isoform X1 [Takifugu flavidus]